MGMSIQTARSNMKDESELGESHLEKQGSPQKSNVLPPIDNQKIHLNFSK